MVQRVFKKNVSLKEGRNKKNLQPPPLSFLLKIITFPCNLKHSVYPFMYIWIVCILSISMCLFWIRWAQVYQKLNFVFCRTQRFMIKQVQIRQLMLLQVQSGVIGPGSRAGSSSSLWAVPVSKPYRVTKANSRCWPPLCLGLGECGSRNRVWWLVLLLTQSAQRLACYPRLSCVHGLCALFAG